MGEPDPTRLEPAVWAYCRELCGPLVCEEAATATILAFGDGGGSSGPIGDRLLRLTRQTAAEHAAAHTNGRSSNGRSSGDCAATPGLLVARANDELPSGQLRKLAEHIQRCLVCKATGLKMKRAERVFSVMQGSLATSVALADSAAPATAASFAGPSALEGGVDSSRARAAVQAYCRELCGPAMCEPAVEATLAAHEQRVGSTPANGNELLRTTRLIAAKHASARPNAPKRSRACAPTPGRLAARATGELTRGEARNLEAHLESCMACQATELRMNRAERAFAALVGLGVVIEPRLDHGAAASVAPAPAPVESLPADPFEPPAALVDWQSAPVEPAPAPVEPLPADPFEPPADRVKWESTPAVPLPVEPLPADPVEPPADRVKWESTPAEPPAEPVEPLVPLATPADPVESIVWPKPGASDAELAAATVAAASAAGYEVAHPPRKPPHQRRTRRSEPGRLGPVLLAGLAMLAAVAAALVVLKLESSGTTKPSVHAVVTHAAASSRAHGAKTHHAAKPKPKPKPVVHRRPAKPHKAAAKVHKTAPKPAKHVAAVTVTPAVHRAPVVTPRRTVAPVVKPTPVVSNPSTPSVIPQGSNLGADTAPVQGISP